MVGFSHFRFDDPEDEKDKFVASLPFDKYGYIEDDPYGDLNPIP